MTKISKAEKNDPALHMEMETLRAERAEQLMAETSKTEQEAIIAEYYGVLGRIQGVKVVADFGNVAGFLWIQQVRERKLYKDIPGVGTWDKFCDSIGMCRKKVEEKLANLAVFGTAFSASVAAFGVGYTDLRRLRQLTYDGTIVIDGDCLVIADEPPIPINQEHAEELQAAIERIITASNETKKRVDRLEKDFKGALKEETLALHSQLKTQTLRVRELEQYEPHAHDETWCEEQMSGIAGHTATLRQSITAFVIDPRLDGDRAAQAGVLAFITQAQNLLYDLRSKFENAFATGE